MDPTDGRVVVETRFEAVPGAPHDSARPYGLLQAHPLEPGALPGVVLVSCQVEEYAVVTHRTPTGGLTRHDGWFVEKDWPADERELRPQPTSLADLRGDGRPLLVVGLWQEGAWRTLVLDPRGSLHDPIATLHGRYFWGCHDVDGDGRPEIVTSRETHRTPRARSTLEAWRGAEARRVATLPQAAILASSNSPLPPHTAFMAGRRNAIAVSLADGRTGVLVRRQGADGPEVGAWAGAGGGPPAFVRLLVGDFDRADAAGDAIVFADAAGRLARVGPGGGDPSAPVEVHGRLATPLAGSPAGGGLVVDRAGGEIVGGDPVAGRDGVLDGAWSVPGTLPALEVDGPQPRLVVADGSDPDRPAMAIHALPAGRVPVRRVGLRAPVYLGIVPVGADGGYVVNLRTGVHTMSLERRDRTGRLRWRDPGKGAYLRSPAVDVVDGAQVTIADDHGELRTYDASGKIAWVADWTAAYTQPIPGPWGPGGEWAILRAGGIHGLELVDAAGETIWRTDAELWEYASSTPAVGWLGDPRAPALGAMTRGGSFRCIDVRTGGTRWALDLGCAPNATSIVAADVDGDGSDEFIAGLPDGRLVCLGESASGRGVERWSVAFDVAVGNPIVVDLDGDGAAELVVATADGDVRWLW